MTEIVVHSIPGSPFGRSVLMALEEKGAPYRLARMRLGAAKSPEHLALNPLGRIPVIEHDGFTLYETQAILRYLDALFPAPPLQPSDPRRAARMNQVVGISDCDLFPKVGVPIAFQRILAPMMGRATDEAMVAAALPRARLCLAELDRLLGDQPFMAGDAMTLADIMTAPVMDYVAQTPDCADMLAGTRLLAWVRRMRERPSMAATTIERLARAPG